MADTGCTLLRMQQSSGSAASGERADAPPESPLCPALTTSVPRSDSDESAELEEIELLSELMILANGAPAKAPTYEIDQALGLRGSRAS